MTSGSTPGMSVAATQTCQRFGRELARSFQLPFLPRRCLTSCSVPYPPTLFEPRFLRVPLVHDLFLDPYQSRLRFGALLSPSPSSCVFRSQVSWVPSVSWLRSILLLSSGRMDRDDVSPSGWKLHGEMRCGHNGSELVQ